MKKSLFISLFLLFTFVTGEVYSQAMSSQRAAVTPITWERQFRKGCLSSGKVVTDSAVTSLVLNSASDTTQALPTSDSVGTQGTYASFWTPATLATASLAIVKVQYGMNVKKLNVKSNWIDSTVWYSDAVTILDSLRSTAIGALPAINPSRHTLFFRTPKAATKKRFIVVYADGITGSGSSRLYGQCVDPSY